MSEPKYTAEDLKIMRSWDLERKIRVSQAKIIEWYQHYDSQVYVSFSGGKDSTILMDLARRIYPDIPALFIDTGLELPEIKSFVRTFSNVDFARPELSFAQVIKKYGYPVVSKEVAHAVYYAKKTGTKSSDNYLQRFDGTLMYNGKKSLYNMKKWKFLLDSGFDISDCCCDVLKKRPAKKYGRLTGRKAIIGTLTEESRLRTQHWLKDGCNAFDGKEPKSHPLSFWTEQNILQYLRTTNIPYATVYGDIVEDENGKLKTTGCERTGCWGYAFLEHI